MSRLAGRNMRVLVDVPGSGAASLVPFIKTWSHDAATDRYDVTAAGDSNKSYVQGLPDAKGTYAGFLDDATAQFYTAAADGISRKTYVYINLAGAPTKYFYGNCFYDQSTELPTDGASAISGSWAADGPWLKSW